MPLTRTETDCPAGSAANYPLRLRLLLPMQRQLLQLLPLMVLERDLLLVLLLLEVLVLPLLLVPTCNLRNRYALWA